MANLNYIKRLPRRIASHCFDYRAITSKVQRTASSIGFIKKALHNGVTPTFAKVIGNFMNDRFKRKVEGNVLRSHLMEHYENLNRLLIAKDKLSVIMTDKVGLIIFKWTNYLVLQSLRLENQYQLNTKNKKLSKLIGRIDEVNHI